MESADMSVIGGGIIGLATAWELSHCRPSARIILLEKQNQLARHQTGRNSGVLHSGIYYQPGSLKAVNCRAGRQKMLQFCDEYGIRYDICGKVIVAVDDSQLAALEQVYRNGQANDVN